MLTDAQRTELKTMGAPNVRLHVAQWPGRGPGSDVPGFKCGAINYGDIFAWLATEDRSERRRQTWILCWAIVGGIAGIAGVIATILHK